MQNEIANEIQIYPEMVSTETEISPEYQNGKEMINLFYSEPIFNPDYYNVQNVYYPEFYENITHESDCYFDYEKYYNQILVSNISECPLSNNSRDDYVREKEKFEKECSGYFKQIKDLKNKNEELIRKLKISEDIIKRQESDYDRILEENRELRRRSKIYLDKYSIIKKDNEILRKECERKESLIKGFKKRMPFRSSSYKGSGRNIEVKDKITSSNSNLKRVFEENYNDFDYDNHSHFKRQKIVYDD